MQERKNYFFVFLNQEENYTLSLLHAKGTTKKHSPPFLRSLKTYCAQKTYCVQKKTKQSKAEKGEEKRFIRFHK